MSLTVTDRLERLAGIEIPVCTGDDGVAHHTWRCEDYHASRAVHIPLGQLSPLPRCADCDRRERIVAQAAEIVADGTFTATPVWAVPAVAPVMGHSARRIADEVRSWYAWHRFSGDVSNHLGVVDRGIVCLLGSRTAPLPAEAGIARWVAAVVQWESVNSAGHVTDDMVTLARRAERDRWPDALCELVAHAGWLQNLRYNCARDAEVDIASAELARLADTLGDDFATVLAAAVAVMESAPMTMLFEAVEVADALVA